MENKGPAVISLYKVAQHLCEEERPQHTLPERAAQNATGGDDRVLSALLGARAPPRGEK